MKRIPRGVGAVAVALVLSATACTPNDPAPSPGASGGSSGSATPVGSGSTTASPSGSATPRGGEDSAQTGEGINGKLPAFPTTMDEVVAEPMGLARSPGKTSQKDFITNWDFVEAQFAQIKALPANPTQADWDRLHQQINYLNAWPAWKLRKPMDSGYVVPKTATTNPYTNEPVKVDGQLNVEIILDASGSMANDAGGMNREEAAKKAIDDLLAQLPAGAKVGIRVYGHKGSNSEADKAVSCQANELVHPVTTLDKAGIDQAISPIQPTGWTPIGASFDAAGKDMADFTAGTDVNAVYLISDGIETCDGDPVASAKQLKDSPGKPRIGVIGFGVDASQGASLKEITDAVGGYYGTASDAASLAEQLKTVTVYNPKYSWAPLTTQQIAELKSAQSLAAQFAKVDGGKCGIVELADYQTMLTRLVKLGKITEAQKDEAPKHNTRCTTMNSLKSSYAADLAKQQADNLVAWEKLVGQDAVVIYPQGKTPLPRQ